VQIFLENRVLQIPPLKIIIKVFLGLTKLLAMIILPGRLQGIDFTGLSPLKPYEGSEV
jgi:hypothetical protein